ncbi:MAG: PP2C family protein-serine/threonine phosphatase [Acidobacteria bacterium]|nr:PP2C family protein-serine/threonine phosphatase [Acidobacteriota bacterium]
MRASSWAIPLLGAVGIGVLAWLYPRHDNLAVEWKPRISRSEAKEKARDLARVYGVDIAEWTTAVTASSDETRAALRRQFPNDPVLMSFNSMEVKVLAAAPDGVQVQVKLTPEGRALSYSRQDRRTAARRDEQEDERLGQRELERYTGAESGQFRKATSGARTQEGIRSAWEWVRTERQGILGRFEVVTSGGQVVRAGYDAEVSERLVGRSRAQKQDVQVTAVVVMVVILLGGGILAIWTFFAGLTRRKDHIRFGARTAAAAAAALVLSHLDGSAMSGAQFGQLAAETPWWLAAIQTLLMGALIATSTGGMFAAGYVILPAGERARWSAMRLLTLGRPARAIGREVLLGIVAGCGLAALPYVAGRLALGPGMVAELYSPSFLFQRAPGLELLRVLVTGVGSTGLFAFFLPWTLATITNRWGRRLAFAVTGTALLAGLLLPFPNSAGTNLLYGALMLAGCWMLYQRTGVVAMWVVWVGFRGAIHTAAFLTSGMAAEAWQTAGMLGGLGVAAAALWAFGVRHDEAEVAAAMEPQERDIARSDRERLLAEFSVARRAQERLLPESPPRIPGCSLAAACVPAREVGGDLYDFVAFPGGTWGFCVADVSGKGVQAALYMTLTKGMLSAASHRAPDLKAIATRINRNVVEAGHKRTFVTMSLGTLSMEQDGDGCVFRHVRAGHNPPLLYRAPGGEVSYLQPRGIGLGFTAGPVFERNLDVAEVRLKPGDVLVLYSDGLTECMNASKEQFGEERLSEVVVRAAAKDAEGIKAEILTAAQEFRGAADPHDDLTVVVLRVDGPMT